MSLHTMGYRPAPEERAGYETRRSFACAYAETRVDADMTLWPIELATGCLDDRLAPDPLVWAQAARIIRVTGLGTGNGDRMAPGLLISRRGERRAGIPADGRG